MAKIHEVNCPFCGHVQKLTLSDMLSSAANGTGMRGAEEEKSKQPSPESLDEANWIDLKKPCSNCNHTFSLNIVTSESRE